MKIPIVNPTTFLVDKTWLSSKYTSGTSLSVKNSDKFVDNDIILLGEPGQERSETTDLTATPPAVTTLTVTALDFAHSKDTPVYKIGYDQVEIHRSTGGVYALLATVNLNYEKMVTIYEDSTGLDTYSYKIRFKNSATAAVTSYSDVQLGSGWPRNSVGRMLRNVRRMIRDLKDKKVHDWEIMEELGNAKDDISGEIPNAFWRLRSSGDLTEADVYSYALPTDYERMLVLLYTYVYGSATEERYALKYMPKTEWVMRTQDQNEDSEDELQGWTELPGDSTNPNGYFGTYPTPETANLAFTLWYFIKEAELNSYGDTTNCPLPQALEYYAASELTDDSELQKKYLAKYNKAVQNLKVRQRRESGPRTLLRKYGSNSVDRMYGRSSVRRTQQDIENYW